MKEKEYKIIIVILLAIIMLVPVYFQIAYKPRNSIELYRAIQFSEDYREAQKLSLKGYEKDFSKEIYEKIVNSSTSPNSVNQFTVLRYDGESYIIETTPGRTKLEILRVVKLPEELKDYLSELTR
ncbi:hypothetical protein [Sporosarcina sp. JAI121]|uniref:hypothetical protein n=1 Tax=Sporosarcina sp. JAI121 TaxID=2723064 RepID=UPI0015C98FBE|nr:hypothetical protein [Sporosarcina sp. JAI121]NYF25845.1 hypothetical protein [Sporosarcina sp. JAI121]